MDVSVFEYLDYRAYARDYLAARKAARREVCKQRWVEQKAPSAKLSERGPTFPLNDPYVVKLHPPSATHGVGLYCDSITDYMKEHDLSIGGVDGYNGFTDTRSNLRLVKARFATKALCEEAREDLLSAYEAEDPDNHGVLAKVERNIEVRKRHILNNAATRECQEVQVDLVKMNLRGVIFRGSRSFIVRTVDYSECLPK